MQVQLTSRLIEKSPGDLIERVLSSSVKVLNFCLLEETFRGAFNVVAKAVTVRLLSSGEK